MYQNEYSANECGLNCVVSIEYLMWKRCTFHLGHGMWFTSSRVLSDLGIFLHPLEHTSALMPRTPKNNCVQSFGFLRSVSLCLFVCIFRKIVRERVFSKDLSFCFQGKDLCRISISFGFGINFELFYWFLVFFLNIEINLWL